MLEIPSTFIICWRPYFCFKLELFRFENGFKPYLVDVNFTFCDFLNSKGEMDNFILWTATKLLQESSNIVNCGHVVCCEEMMLKIYCFSCRKDTIGGRTLSSSFHTSGFSLSLESIRCL